MPNPKVMVTTKRNQIRRIELELRILTKRFDVMNVQIFHGSTSFANRVSSDVAGSYL